MKKLLPLIVLLLLATWAGATWLISGQVEQNFDRALNQLNSKLAQDLPFVEVKPASFHKGFFKSEATSQVTLTGPQDDADMLPLRHVIYHGPVMLTPLGVKTGSTYIVTSIDMDMLPAETRDKINDLTGGDTPLTIGMLTGTSKDFDLDIEVASLQLDDPQNSQTTIRFEGMHGALKSDLQGSYLTGKLANGKISIADQNGQQVEIAPTTIRFDIDEMYKGTVLSGSSSLTTAQLLIHSPALETRAENLSFTSATTQAGNGTTSASATFNTSPASIEVASKNIRFTDGTVDFTTRFEGIDTTALKKLVDAGADLHGLEIAAMKKGEVEPEKIQQNLDSYLSAVIDLLKPGLESTTRLDIGNPQGKAWFDLALNYAETRPVTELATLRDLIAAIDGRLEIVSDKPLLRSLSLDGLAAMPIAMGFATADNDQIRSEVTISKGVLSINGQPAPFLEMFGPILDEPSPLRRLTADTSGHSV